MTRQETEADAATLAFMNKATEGFLPALVGLRIVAAGAAFVEAEIAIERHHMAPNGFLHAGTVITLADSACGIGCVRALPEGASGFTTVELKSNFLGTARDGVIYTIARAVHLGRTTQLWDAEVKHRGTGKTLAHFRCTQLVLWPSG